MRRSKTWRFRRRFRFKELILLGVIFILLIVIVYLKVSCTSSLDNSIGKDDGKTNGDPSSKQNIDGNKIGGDEIFDPIYDDEDDEPIVLPKDEDEDDSIIKPTVEISSNINDPNLPEYEPDSGIDHNIDEPLEPIIEPTLEPELSPNYSGTLLDTIKSPNEISVMRILELDNCIEYLIEYDGTMVIGTSSFLFSVGVDMGRFCDVKLLDQNYRMIEDDWNPVAGQREIVPNRYTEAILTFGDESNEKFQLTIRAFDEGIAFQLQFKNPSDVFKSSSKSVDLTIQAQVNMSIGIEGILYQDRGGENGFASQALSKAIVNGWTWDLPMHPMTVQYSNEICFSLTEAENLNFESLRFATDSSFEFVRAYFKKTDFRTEKEIKTPWFTFILGSKPGDLIERAYIVDNLNEPCQIEDTTWIIPGKVFRDLALSTESGKASINLAVFANMNHILLDAGWYGDEYSKDSDPRNWKPIPKKAPLDLVDVINYGKSKGIGVWLYVNDIALKKYFNEILPLFSSWGVAGIKFGFVNLSSSKDNERILGYIRECAKYKLMVNIHDNFRPTGFSRTYPNLVSIEGIRGDEHQANSEHALILPFVRYLGGMADNTFVFDNERLKKMGKTVTQQFALPIVYFNPLAHLFWYRDPWSISRLFNAHELPHLTVWELMPTIWSDTKVITSKIGEFITIARKSQQGIWFLASVTNLPQQYEIQLDFLTENEEYTLEQYLDDEADLYTKGRLVSGKARKGDKYKINMLKGGGDLCLFTPSIPNQDTNVKVIDPGTGFELVKGEAHLPWQQGTKRSFSSPLEPHDTLYKSLGPYDSKIYLFSKDPRDYKVCTFFDVCYNANNMYLFVSNDASREFYNKETELCMQNSPLKQPFCRCFAKSLKPIFLKDASQLPSYYVDNAHHWISDHWVSTHQIAHWIEKLALLHSIFLKPEGYQLPAIDKISFIKSPEPMTPVEEIIYKLSTSDIPHSENLKAPLFSSATKKYPICVPQASSSSLLATMANSPEDLQAFRKTVNNYLGTSMPTEVTCPPAKTFLLQRTEPANRLRRMINQQEVEDLLKEKFQINDLQIVSTSSQMDVKEQMRLFGEFGLMIASHSSQLIFSIFSQPGAAIIEVVPTYFNSDFSGMASKTNLHYNLAVGGSVPGTDSNLLKLCNENFGHCEGDPQCYEKSLRCSKEERGKLKEGDFNVDLDQLEKIVAKTIEYLNSICDGHWPGVGEK